MATLSPAWSTQAATVTPSLPAVVSAKPAPGPAPSPAAESAAAPAAAPEPHAQARFTEALAKAAQQIEEYLRSSGRDLEFRIDEATGRTVVSVRDPQTGEVIRQIPSEEALRIAQHLDVHTALLLNITV
ncbi:MAG TPA: flagellar protein FlaG [Steroidobacteraceae bacterium]